MHLKAHKYVLVALLLFGLGFLVGTSLDLAYRRYTRERAALLYAETLNSAPKEEEAQPFVFPRDVAGMPRSELLTGSQARDFISGYVGNGGSITEAYIGTFKGSRGEVVIFAADYTDSSEAREIRKMMERSLEEKAPFDASDIFELYAGVSVNRFLDRNTVHYFFSKGSRLLWVTVKSEEPLEVLRDVYTHF